MKIFLILFIFGLIGLSYAYLTEIKLWIINLPCFFSDVHVTQNIEFDKEHHLKLDIYDPPKNISPKNKIIVFFYGGNWTFGNKEQYRFIGTSLAQSGYKVVIPDYRKYPQIRYPDFVYDAASAVKWVHQNLSDENGQKQDIILMGHSAGANLAFLVLSDPKYGVKNQISIYAGVGLAGPYNFTPNSDVLREIFKPSEYDDMRPYTHFDASEPPVFMGYGLRDDLVARMNIDMMAEKLSALNAPYRKALYPKKNHSYMLSDFSWVADKAPNVKTDVLNFLDKPR